MTTADSTPAPRRGRSRWRLALLGVGLLGVLIALCGLAVVVAYRGVCQGHCVDLSVAVKANMAQEAVVVDAKGREMGTLSIRNRRVADLSALPSILPRAFIAVEDRRFYQHHGVDWIRVAGAIGHDILAMRAREGSSTISMQLARNIYPEVLPPTSRTLKRKLMEIRVARSLEGALSKSQILERYLNTIYLGNGTYGVDAAARGYFGIPASEMTLSEAALLAGLPKAPEGYNPRRHPAAALARRNLVLRLMAQQGVITTQEEAAAQNTPLGLAPVADLDSDGRMSARFAPYAVDEVRRLLEPILGRSLYTQGYRIETSIDSVAQVAAESSLEAGLVKVEQGKLAPWHGPVRDPSSGRDSAGVLQGAIVMMSADSGDIVALVGGRSYAVSPFNRATQALRQMGSVFKPVVYAAAFASGIDPDDLVSDEPVTVDMGDETWTPKNFDSQGADTITVADALIHSRNRATVRVALAAGLQSVQATALRLGFTDLPHVPSVVLGAADSRVLTVTSAYTAFAREDGQRVVPRLVTRVLDAHGQVLFQASVTTVPALTPDVARTVRQLLQAVVNHGTGASVRNWFSGAAAGKTGTTNDGNDVWFVGATPHYVASVWVGFDRPRTILGGNEGTGGRIAAPIWGRLMKAYLGRDASTWKNTPRITESSDSTEADSAAFPSQANDSVAVPDTTQ